MVSEKTSFVGNVVIRVDASIQIGSGHVMRCLTLAEGLREQGAEVLFVCRELSGNLNALIAAKGFDLCCLPAADSQSAELNWNSHAGWLEVHWQQDAKETKALLKEQAASFDWLIVDHYALDTNWETELGSIVDKIMVIDDLADRPHACELLLDQNFYLDQTGRYKKLVPANCTRLLGPAYALLRSEFPQKRRSLRLRTGAVNNILVFFGGVDATNETAKVVNAIASLERSNITVDVIVGTGNPHRQKIEDLCGQVENTRFHCQASNMAELMANADLAIGGGGTVTWERFCLGLPALVVSVAGNQKAIAEDCGKVGCQIFLGDSDAVDEALFAAALQTVLHSPSLLMSVSAQAIKVVDGKGLNRVIQWLCPLDIKLRKAVSADCRNIYDWRNAEETRRHIFDKEIIPYESHQQWFANSLANQDRIILIGEYDDQPVGVLRYDVRGKSALISVYLVPGPQPAGVGSQLICAGNRWLRAEHPEIMQIDAEILGQNVASIKAFEKADYKLHHLTYCKDLFCEE